ncbi:MAG TPA: beta-propeller fold lactonase family protein [bacterium]|nr:beta-propeller fold lactonase family protein [bacterium]
MNRNESAPFERIVATIKPLVPLCVILALSACDNALFDTAKELQAQTVTPVLSLRLVDGTLLGSGGTLDIGYVTTIESPEVELTIKNDGKTTLVIADGDIAITGTSASYFTITQMPAASIPAGGSSTLRMKQSICGTVGTLEAALLVPSNDINNPNYSFKMSSTITDLARPEVPANLSVARLGTEPSDWTKLVLTWTLSAHATGYEVQRDTNKYGTYTTVFPVEGGDTSTFTDATCMPGTMYYYRVYAVNTGLNSITPSLIIENMTLEPKQVLYVANFGGYLDYDFIDTHAWSKSQSGYGAVGDGPSCTVVDASGKFLYESNTGTNPLVLGISGNLINQTNGTVGLINRVYPDTVTEGLVVASPNGPTGQQFVYCTFRSAHQVGVFAINNTTGWLSPIGGFPPPLTLVYWSDGSSATGYPRWLAVDPSGKHLYVSNSASDTISMFSINPATGALTFVDNHSTGDCPYKSTVTPDGKFLYVVNVNGASVSVFSIDSATGALSLVGTYSTGTGPTCIAIDSLQRYAYVTNGGSNSITAYTIDVDGLLSPIHGSVADSSYGTGVYPNSVAVDLTGTYLVVANSNSNNASVYSIALGTGALTPTLVFSTGLDPVHLAFQRLP